MSKVKIILDRGIPEIVEGEDYVAIIDLDFPDSAYDVEDLETEVERLEIARKEGFPDWVIQRIADFVEGELDIVEDPKQRAAFEARIKRS